MKRSREFGRFFADASGGEGDRCNYVNANPDDCCNLRKESK